MARKATSNTALSSGAVNAPEATTTELDRFEVTLPVSGKVASILRRGNGKLLLKAERLTGPGVAVGSMTWAMAMIAIKARIDGRDLTVEDVEDLDETDILFLMGEVLGKGR